jgi:hypothetical protein
MVAVEMMGTTLISLSSYKNSEHKKLNSVNLFKQSLMKRDPGVSYD